MKTLNAKRLLIGLVSIASLVMVHAKVDAQLFRGRLINRANNQPRQTEYNYSQYGYRQYNPSQYNPSQYYPQPYPQPTYSGSAYAQPAYAQPAYSADVDPYSGVYQYADPSAYSGSYQSPNPNAFVPAAPQLGDLGYNDANAFSTPQSAAMIASYPRPADNVAISPEANALSTINAPAVNAAKGVSNAAMPQQLSEPGATIEMTETASIGMDDSRKVPAEWKGKQIRLTYDAKELNSVTFKLNGSEMTLAPGGSLVMTAGQQWKFSVGGAQGLQPLVGIFQKPGNFLLVRTEAGYEMIETETQVKTSDESVTQQEIGQSSDAPAEAPSQATNRLD